MQWNVICIPFIFSIDNIKFTVYIYSVNLTGENYGQTDKEETDPSPAERH